VRSRPRRDVHVVGGHQLGRLPGDFRPRRRRCCRSSPPRPTSTATC
jgi:hypothetical protein